MPPIADGAAFTTTVTPPRSVNLTALPHRFTRICRNRPASSRTSAGTESATSALSASPLASADTRIIRTT
jgi:hypothetical protein